MKQITLVLHYDDDGLAEAVYKVLRDVKRHGGSGSVASLPGRAIVHVEMKSPND